MHCGPGRSTDIRMAKRRNRLSVLTRSGGSDRPKSSITADLAPTPSAEGLWTRPKPHLWSVVNTLLSVQASLSGVVICSGSAARLCQCRRHEARTPCGAHQRFAETTPLRE